MAEYQFRRIRFPFQPPFLFDLRFNGAAQQIVQGRYQSFLNNFYRMAYDLNRHKEITAKLDDLSADVIEILHEARRKKFDPVKMCVRLNHYRNELADKVSKEIGRDATGDNIRRMGIGDQIVLIGIIQSIAKLFGGDSVLVVYDKMYPSIHNLLKMTRIRSIDIGPDVLQSEFCDLASNYIDLRRHMLEHPLCDGVPCYYGEKTGDPAAQVLWNLGWEHSLRNHLVGHTRLIVGKPALDRALKVVPNVKDFVTCQPLEATRLNKYTNANVYSHVIQSTGIDDVVFGSSRNDLAKLTAFVKDMALPKRYRTHFLTEGLETWLGIIGLSKHMITGNTSGMWLGFSTNVPMTVLSKSDSLHGEMWNVKEKWFEPERWKAIRVFE
jgi:hypothetical protein